MLHTVGFELTTSCILSVLPCIPLSSAGKTNKIIIYTCFYIQCFHSVSLAVIYFKSEPLPYYYSYSGSVTLIPCVAVRVNDAGDEIPIAATLYRNSESFTTANRPNRHQVYLPDRVAAGVVVNPTLDEDAGTRYHCEVEDGEGEVVAVSTETRLLVGGQLWAVPVNYMYTVYVHSHT